MVLFHVAGFAVVLEFRGRKDGSAMISEQVARVIVWRPARTRARFRASARPTPPCPRRSSAAWPVSFCRPSRIPSLLPYKSQPRSLPFAFLPSRRLTGHGASDFRQLLDCRVNAFPTFVETPDFVRSGNIDGQAFHIRDSETARDCLNLSPVWRGRFCRSATGPTSRPTLKNREWDTQEAFESVNLQLKCTRTR